jgi:N-acetylglucosaminyldiphosphoundecaprenol N-acetyl-beta-D-mannosaminyltransferase
MSASSPTLPRPNPAAAPFRRERRVEERVGLLGAQVDLVRPEEVFHHAGRRIAAGERYLVANHNLHSLALRRVHPELDAFFARADLIEVDSAPLIAWARLLGHPARSFHRCTYLDWRHSFWAQAAREGWRVFVLAGRPGVAASACARILAEHPNLELAARSGWFDAAPGSAEDRDVVGAINRFQPDVLMVGMGMPRQELWVLRNLEALPACAVFTVGGAFDYEAGVQTACPRWLGQLGLEWLFRLLNDPKRLFVRYCVEPWSLLPLAARDFSGRIAHKGRRDRSARIEPAGGLL